MIPPIIAHIKIKNEENRGINLWFPVLIFWIIALPFVLLALILLGIGSLFLHPATRRRVWKIIGNIYTILCQLRYARVDVESNQNTVVLRFI
jgi:hypothetical protein